MSSFKGSIKQKRKTTIKMVRRINIRQWRTFVVCKHRTTNKIYQIDKQIEKLLTMKIMLEKAIESLSALYYF
jgi:hypothetical protein